jgi:hypothetical protein
VPDSARALQTYSIVVAVRIPFLDPSYHYHTVVLTTSQAAIIQVDAADDKATLDICHQALRDSQSEEAQTNVFFATVRAHHLPVVLM